MEYTMPKMNSPSMRDLDKPFESYHDISTTSESIKQLLADGTPNWMRFPHEYKAFAKESMQAERENSQRMAAEYKWVDQELLANREKTNGIGTRDFIAKLRNNGVKCFTVDNGFPPQTVALWAIPPGQDQKARYVCYLQVPAMYEWSILKLDRNGIPVGEDFRGWRTVAVQLVQKEILTEQKMHEIFGVPTPNANSARYFRTLWETRHGARYADPDSLD
jgi:hypothetical protein